MQDAVGLAAGGNPKGDDHPRRMRRRLTPYGRRIVDGRSHEGRFLRAARHALIRQLGGNVTPAQATMVERIAWLQLRCSMLDEKIVSGNFTEHDSRQYLAWSNTLRKTLVALNLELHPESKTTVADILAEVRK
ncbi:MAG: hypothetical protein ACRDHZ_01520 [Ktedonobacteraceae bacterium]